MSEKMEGKQLCCGEGNQLQGRSFACPQAEIILHCYQLSTIYKIVKQFKQEERILDNALFSLKAQNFLCNTLSPLLLG